MKKLISMLGALCMLCTAIPSLPASVQETTVISADAAAIESGVYENIRYEKYDGYIEITGAADAEQSIQGELVIPAEINGLPVTAIRQTAFHNNHDMTAVVIPDTVTSIGDYAFTNCTSLNAVTFPAVMPDIGACAFLGTALMSNYENLLSYTVYDDHVEIEGPAAPKYELQGTLIIPPEIDGLPVTVIKNAAFSFCEELTAVVIPDTVTSIESKSFLDCTNLDSVTFPAQLPALGEGVFTGTAWLNKAEGENSLLILDNVLVKGTGSAGDVIIPDGVTAIASDAFSNCDELTSVIIPDTVTSIGEKAFLGCTSLTSVTIPDTVTSIGGWAFYDCYSLKSVRLPANLQHIGIRVFEYSGLTEVIIPEGVTEIGNGDFSCCTGLKSVIIPNSVTYIGEDAFGGCRLETVVLPDNGIVIGSGAFYLSNLTSVTIPNNAQLEDNPFCRCENLTEINVSENNPNYTVQDGILLSKDKTVLIACPASKTGEFIVPDTVTSIGDYAFLGCTQLTSVVIPDSVTSIGTAAFRDCDSLISVNLPSGMTTIADGTFLSCKALQSIEIPENITSIGDNAFNFCNSLETITIKNPDCEIYNSINTIRNYAVRNGRVIDFDGTICGFENSTAQTYAETYGYPFEPITVKTLDNAAPVQSQEQNSENTSGDVNGDNEVDIRDVIMVNKAIFGKESLTGTQLKAIDFNRNGMPDSEDSLTLLKYITGLIDELS